MTRGALERWPGRPAVGDYGLFLVAALSGRAFWVLEATTKVHQMRYCPRMGDIEATAYELFSMPLKHGRASTPFIDWSWSTAKQRFMRPWLWPHVTMPHCVSVVAGAVLFVLGLAGVFEPI